MVLSGYQPGFQRAAAGWESRLKVRLLTDRCRFFYFRVLGDGCWVSGKANAKIKAITVDEAD